MSSGRRLIIGLTGGIASGKSLVCQAFVGWGIPVIDADWAARQVMASTEMLDQIKVLFGVEAFTADGAVNRRYIRQVIFDSPARRQQFEAIIHPPIRAYLEDQAMQQPLPEGAYVIIAIPLLAESGGKATYPWLDRILAIIAPETIRIERLMKRDQIDQSFAQRIIQAQASDAQRIAIADDVLENYGSADALTAHALPLHQQYCRLAQEKARS